jgi:DNA-binding response OmpR family regulator
MCDCAVQATLLYVELVVLDLGRAEAPIIVIAGPAATVNASDARDAGAMRIRIGDVIVDLVAMRVVRPPGEADAVGQAGDIRLTPTEWRLLEVLLRSPGRLLSRQHLLAEVWGPGYARATGNLRLYMAQLRRKLEPDPARPRWLITEPGLGYRFQPGPRRD